MSHEEILRTYIPKLERENDSYFVNDKEVSKEVYVSLARIQSGTYTDETFEEDTDELVPNIYEFAVEGIAKAEALFDDRLFMLETMLRDIKVLRNTIVSEEHEKWKGVFDNATINSE